MYRRFLQALRIVQQRTESLARRTFTGRPRTFVATISVLACDAPRVRELDCLVGIRPHTRSSHTRSVALDGRYGPVDHDIRRERPTGLHDLQGAADRGSARAKMSPNLIKAVISVEDQRFYEHSGVDVVRIGRRGPEEPAVGTARRRRQHHHAAAGAAELSDARQDVPPQAAGVILAALPRAPVLEAGDSRALPQQGLLRRRSVRRRGGVARLFRQARLRALRSTRRRSSPA